VGSVGSEVADAAGLADAAGPDVAPGGVEAAGRCLSRACFLPGPPGEVEAASVGPSLPDAEGVTLTGEPVCPGAVGVALECGPPPVEVGWDVGLALDAGSVGCAAGVAPGGDLVELPFHESAT
jgi:hypothetical protein